MLIRKTALAAASLAATLAGANQAEAGLFGRRICCPTTPVQCPASTTGPIITSNPSYTYPVSDPCTQPVYQSDYHGNLIPCVPTPTGPAITVNNPRIQYVDSVISTEQLKRDLVQIKKKLEIPLTPEDRLYDRADK